MPSINRTSAAVEWFLTHQHSDFCANFYQLKLIKIDGLQMKVKGWLLASRLNKDILFLNTNYLPDPYWLTVQGKMWSRAVALFQDDRRPFSILAYPKKFFHYTYNTNITRDIPLMVVEHGWVNAAQKKKYEGGVPYVFPHT